jgi:beta-lactamase class A
MRSPRRRRVRRRGLVGALAACLLACAPGARADDFRVLAVAKRELPAAASAASGARGGGPDAVQAQYDAARDLGDALVAAAPASPTCVPLARILSRFAEAEVGLAEAFDRGRATPNARLERAAAAALAQSGPARAACAPHAAHGQVGAPAPARIADPGGFEAFFGGVRAPAPASAVRATVTLAGRVVGSGAVTGGWLRLRLRAAPAHGDLVVRFVAASGVVVGRSVSHAVWLLPRRGSAATTARQDDARADAALARVAAGFAGISAIYSVDLTTGAMAAWNADARFPAASTAKLGVLAAVLRRLGPHPEDASAFYDLRQLAGWSSNLAANRLLVTLGGSETRGAALAQDELHRLGARSSTYPGGYIAGTAFHRVDPPAISARVTTARDLGTLLATLQQAATGSREARTASGLSIHQARVALGLLLSSQPAGDNVGLLRTAVGARTPMAQKQGWISDARLTAAIIYTDEGPRIVVVCAYRPDLTLARASRLGRSVLQALRIA